MSFTQDELQALNSIVEQKLSLQRRELERTFEQRLQASRRDIEQKLTIAQQDMQRNLVRRFTDQQRKLRTELQQALDLQQVRTIQAINQVLEKKEQQQHHYLEELLERSLAVQLVAFEQQITQRFSDPRAEFAPLYTSEPAGEYDAIEVQTEIPWEDLVDLIDKVLDERLAVLSTSLQTRLRDTEQTISEHIQHLLDILMHPQISNYSEAMAGANTNMQDLFESILQLERIVESLQVAMTANSTLLSNRLSHHQQLPLERAHPKGCTFAQPCIGQNGMSQLPQQEE